MTLEHHDYVETEAGEYGEVPVKTERRTGPWRCFHCDEVFETAAEASQHFGHWENEKPICQFDADEIRQLQKQLLEWMDDATPLHLEIYRLQSEMEASKRRAEEEGYARGLRDAIRYPEELGLQKVEPVLHDLTL